MADDAVKYGIETLKEVAIWNVNLIEEIYALVEKAKEKKKRGRKISGWAATKFIDDLVNGIMLGAKYEEIALEWLDLDEEEKKQLVNLVRKELDIEHAFAEEVAERLFYLLLEIGDTMTFIFSKKKTK